MRLSVQVGVLVVSACVLCACLRRELEPLNPCLTSEQQERVDAHGINKVDLLFVVDNSGSMVEEQAKLRAQFPKLIRTLTTGVREDGTVFAPVADLHLAVITTDLGTPGITTVSGCTEQGSDGVFRHDGNPSKDPTLTGCAASYPTFLQFVSGRDDPSKLASDFACIGTVGSGGCGYEQQLEAPLKALWPRVQRGEAGEIVAPDFQFLGVAGAPSSLGHGDAINAGFLRNDPDDPSLLAIVLVTDEDDCSASSSEQFGTGAAYASQHANLRCHENPERMWPIARYVDHFKRLRPEHPELVVFAAIAGIPEHLIDRGTAANRNDARARDAFYDSILGDPSMQQTPVDLDHDGQVDHLAVACESENGGEAYPARRIVQVAKGLGAQATVQSICSETFEPAMDAVIELITDRLKGVCLSRPLVRNDQGVVSCEVVWELPPASATGSSALHDCSELAYLSRPGAGRPQTSVQGRALCTMTQLPVREKRVVTEPTASEGWYYDNFSEQVLSGCTAYASPQRVSFTANATPPAGVTVSLQCHDEAQRYVDNRTDVDATGPHPEIGESCEELAGLAVSHDAMCWVSLANRVGGPNGDGIDRSLFCHPTQNLCVRACTSDTDCPAAWVCDGRPTTLAATASTRRDPADLSRPDGRAICVNPTCGVAGGD